MPSPQDELQREITAHEAAARAERAHRERTTGKSGIRASLTFIAVLLLVNGGLVWLIAQGGMTEAAAAYVIPAVTIPLFFGGLFLILRWQAKAKTEHQWERPDVAAPTAVDLDDVPRAAPRQSSSLERAARRAALERFAEPRLSTLWYSKRAITESETFYGAIFLGPLLLGASVASAAAINDAKPLPPEEGWALAALWVGVFVGGGLVLALRHRRQQRLARRHHAFAVLATPLSKSRLLEHEGVVDWLNRNWPAATEAEDSHVGRANCAVAAELHGYPTLIEVDPEGRSDEYVTFPPRALVYLCAVVPEHVAREPAFAELFATLSNLDFSLQCVPRAGFLARAGAGAIVPCQADPPELSRLTFVADQLLRCALRLGIPAPPVD